MSLFSTMASKIHSIANSYITTNFNQIIAHIIKITSHSNKATPTNFITNKLIKSYSKRIKRATRINAADKNFLMGFIMTVKTEYYQ